MSQRTHGDSSIPIRIFKVRPRSDVSTGDPLTIHQPAPLEMRQIEQPHIPAPKPLETQRERKILIASALDYVDSLAGQGAAPSTQQTLLTVKRDHVTVGQRPGINFQAGAGIQITVADDPANNDVDVTIEATSVSPLALFVKDLITDHAVYDSEWVVVQGYDVGANGVIMPFYVKISPAQPVAGTYYYPAVRFYFENGFGTELRNTSTTQDFVADIMWLMLNAFGLDWFYDGHRIVKVECGVHGGDPMNAAPPFLFLLRGYSTVPVTVYGPSANYHPITSVYNTPITWTFKIRVTRVGDITYITVFVSRDDGTSIQTFGQTFEVVTGPKDKTGVTAVSVSATGDTGHVTWKITFSDGTTLTVTVDVPPFNGAPDPGGTWDDVQTTTVPPKATHIVAQIST